MTTKQQFEKLDEEVSEFVGMLEKVRISLDELDKTFSCLRNEAQELLRQLKAKNNGKNRRQQ